MAAKKKGMHFTEENRQRIEEGIKNGESKVSIAKDIGSDPTTVAKEIKRNLMIVDSRLKLTMNDCALYARCRHRKQCQKSCKEYVRFSCKRRDRTPGACNGCAMYTSCHFEKHKYNYLRAEMTYRETLHDSRAGVDLTAFEAKEIGDLLKQLLNQGQSLYEIIRNHPELGVCEKTLYNYIESGVFDISGVHAIDLRLQTKRRYSMTKKKALMYKKRRDLSYIKGRTHADLETFIQEQEAKGIHVSVVEMDTMYNDVTNGPFIQTFNLVDAKLTLAIYHSEKTAASMVSGVNQIEDMLGSELFEKTFQVLKPDRGTEFINAEGFEKRSDGSQRTRVYYCDPMASWQKPHVENKHIEYRYVLPNKADLHALGLNSQKELNLVLSHLNSRTLKSVGDGLHSAFEYARFYFPDLVDRFYAFGIEEVDKNYVILKPFLLNKKEREAAFIKIRELLTAGFKHKK